MISQPLQSKHHYKIEGERLVLKPYACKFVQEYHQWFVDDEELLYLTGSEPLTLQEQFENHESWISDPTKYTFIIFDRNEKMIGDINLFFSKWIQPNQAEINIMIALKSERGKGYAKEALKLVEAFAFVYYHKNEIIAKIKDDNEASMKLFEKSGYVFTNHSQSFKETEYRKKLQGPIELYQSQLTRIQEISNIQELFSK